MIFLYLLLAVIAVIAVLLLVCLVRACINRKSVPETPLVRKENPDAMRIAGKLSKMVQVNTVVLPGEDNPHQFDPMIETLSQLFPNVFEKFQRAVLCPECKLHGHQIFRLIHDFADNRMVSAAFNVCISPLVKYNGTGEHRNHQMKLLGPSVITCSVV